MFARGANSKWRVVAGKTRIGKGTRNLLGKLRSNNNGTVRQVRQVHQVPGTWNLVPGIWYLVPGVPSKRQHLSN